ncbi:MAG: Protein kinase [Proteobacteria bacterium]|nr:Protein kinase [Pseudomonadota bacterium]
MGTVYRAHDPLIDRTVAIKTVGCAGLSRDEAEAFEQRFYLEAKSAGRLNHPNIVTIHDVGRCDDLAYIAMEYLTGQTLREILDSGVVLTPERSAEIAARVADGLAFAHANNVVHRDIKPANIMVLENGSVKIADFGVALMPSGSLTVSGTAFGSPKYMSPEQVMGQKADGRSDIFSLGVVLYEMLAGRPPFTGDDLNAILYQVLNSAPPLPSSYNPNLPRGFDRIVARALAKNPEKRFQNAAEMAAALRQYRRLAKMTQKQPETDATPVSPSGPGDATVRLKTLAPPPAPVGAWRFWRLGLPLLIGGLVGGWLLLAPEENSPPAEPALPSNGTAPAPETAALPVATGTPAASPEVPVAAPPVVAEGRIRLAIAPWGEVYVDGRMAGVTPPLNEIRLPSGKHEIEIRNGSFPSHRQSVDLAPDANFRIKHKFQ